MLNLVRLALLFAVVAFAEDATPDPSAREIARLKTQVMQQAQTLELLRDAYAGCRAERQAATQQRPEAK